MEVTQSRKKGHRVGKLVPPSLVAWRACTKIRDAPAEKRRESKVQRKSTRTEMLFLYCTILSHTMLLNVWNWSLLRSEGNVQNWVRRRSYYLNLCEAHGLNTWGQLPHLVNNGRKIMFHAENFVLFFVQGFIDSFFMLYLTYVSDIVITGLKILLCVQQQYEVRIWVNKHNKTCHQTQSQDDEQALGHPLPPDFPWGEM